MTAFHDYILGLGSCVLWHNYRAGHINDLSPSGLSAVFAGGHMRRGPKGDAYLASAGTPGGIVVADTGVLDPLRLTEGTLMVFGDELNPTTTTSYDRLLSKQDGVGTNYSFRLNGPTNQLVWYDGTNTRTTAVIDKNLTQIAVPFKNLETPNAYGDGELLSAFSGAIDAVESSADLQIGRLYTNTHHLTRYLYDSLIFTAQLTHTEIGKANALWLKSRPSHGHRCRIWVPPVDLTPSLTAQYGRGRTPDGKWLDFKQGGTGEHGTIAPGMTESDGAYTTSITVSDNTLVVPITLPTVLDYTAGTFSGWVKADESGAFALINQIGGGGSIIYVYCLGAGATITTQLGTTVAQSSGIVGKSHVYYHVALTWNGSTGLFYVNGTLTNTWAYGGLTANTATRLGLTGANLYKCVISDCRFFSSALSDATIREIYLQGARRVLLSHPRGEWPVDVAAVSAPGRAGPWGLISGAGRWTDDGTKRQLTLSSANASPALSCHASFGTFRLTFNKDTQEFWFNFSQSTRYATMRTAGQTGYIAGFTTANYCRIYRRDAGGYFTLGDTGASVLSTGTDYTMHVTRDAIGVIRVYLLGGAYAAWTLILTGVADLTYTSSQGISLEADTSDVSNLEVRLGPMTPQEFDAVGA